MKLIFSRSGKITFGFCVLLGLFAAIVATFLTARAQRPDAAPPSDPSIAPSSRINVSAEQLFPHGINAVGRAATDEETLALAAALAEEAPGRPGDVVGRVERYIAERPQSAYTPSLRVDLAVWQRGTGRFSRALENWAEAWVATSRMNDPVGKNVADRALPHLARLLASLGRLDELEALIKQERSREISDYKAFEIWATTREAAFRMRNRPGLAYRCGTLALEKVAAQLTGRRFGEIRSLPSSINGFTLAELAALSEQNGIGLAPAFRGEGADWIVPAVAHWKQNHYAALTREANGTFFLEDPTFVMPLAMDEETLIEESSGYFLVPVAALQTPGWRAVGPAEALQVFGKGYPQVFDDDDNPNCPPDMCCTGGPAGGGKGPGGKSPGGGGRAPGRGGGGGGARGPIVSTRGCEGCGMAAWSVQEPNINLIVSDIPMRYEAAYGPPFELNVTWRQRQDLYFIGPDHSFFGNGWTSDLLAWVNGDVLYAQGLNPAVCYVGWGNGSFERLDFDSGSVTSRTHPASGIRAVRNQYPSDTNIISSVDVYYPDGSLQRFTAYDLAYGSYAYRLEWRKDATGNAMTFTYDKPSSGSYSNRLTRVTTADNAQFNFSYTDSNQFLITGVTGPNSRSASFSYTSGNLQSITDAAGMTSSFGYTGSWITSLVTPYGTNTFAHDFAEYCDGHQLGCSGVDRSLIVTEPDGSRQVFAFYDNTYRWHGSANGMSGKIPTAFASGQIPAYSGGDPAIQTLDTLRDERNSHHWNRQQAAQLSTLTVASFTAADYRLSRTQHWLRDYEYYNSMNTVGWELPPSPDGSSESQPIFYDYAGKSPDWEATNSLHIPYGQFAGTNQRPAVISQRMLDGTTAYTYFERNFLGHPTRQIDRWVQNGTTTYRTNSFIYASGTGIAAIDNILPLRHTGPYNEIIFGRSLHGSYPDQIGTETNAVGEVTTFNYDAQRRMTTQQTHAGLLSTYTYNGSNGRLEKVVDSVSGTPVRTNSYTWLNGYLRTDTDPRGFTRTYDYDFLERLTQITYSVDGTTETFAYSLPNGVGFNSSGSSLSILDLVTSKDRLGNYSRTVPNRLRQIESHIEPSKTSLGSFGTETRIAYCGCGSPDSSTRAYGTGEAETTSYVYDFRGALTKMTLHNSTAITNKYDLLGRLSVREDALMKATNTYDNLGRLIARHNAAGLMEGYGYDLRDRVIASTNSSGVILTNAYDGLGRLLVRGYPTAAKELWLYTPGYAGPTKYTNQLTEITTWAYDASQRRTNEVGTGVYTNRFTYSPADDLRTLTDGKGQVTAWGYDSHGRVTSKTNQSNVQILTYAYDANSRLTNRWSSAKGNAKYAYDAVGSLTNVDYAASTDIRFKYSSLNRLTNMVDAAGTTAFTYNTAGDLLTENGPFGSDLVTYGYHANVPHLRTTLSLQQPIGSWGETNNYDAAKRLSSVVSPAGTFTYTYSTGVGSATTASPLWNKLALFSGSSAYITNAFDSSGRLTDTWLRHSSHVNSNRHSYVYNHANRRTQQTFLDASTAGYTYDGIGQLKVSDNSINTEDRGYLYDAAWNLNTRTNNGVPTAFAVNAKNELTSVAGTACTYDNNGNLTSDGTRTFSYDDENQLISVTSGTSYRNDFVYDGMGRMKKKLQYLWTGSWSLYIETRYVHDGRRVIQERNGSDLPEVAYTRGWDKSGSFGGAGGIGGLLARSQGYAAGNWTAHDGYHADGNGNITAMVSTAQVITARYKYDPFGNLISSSGTMAGANMYRFSSKELMVSPNIYYYGFRFYEPNFQRWLNRDPRHESGFQALSARWVFEKDVEINLYAFVRNRPLDSVDPFGLINWGPWGGHCCNKGSDTEWAIIGQPGRWVQLKPGECTSQFDDCDAMTCKGGLYKIPGLMVEAQCTDGPDSKRCEGLRWTPGGISGPPGSGLPEGPGNFIPGNGDAPPPNYVWPM